LPRIILGEKQYESSLTVPRVRLKLLRETSANVTHRLGQTSL
jgi:hypothetical protein